MYEALRRLHDEGKPHRKYFHYKLDICNYIDRNWGSLCPSKKRTPTWNNTVSAVITTHPKLFKSNRKQSGYWTLKKLTPGGNDGSSDEEDIAGVAPAAMDDYDSGLGEHQGGIDIGRMPKSKRQQQILLQQQQQAQQQQQQAQQQLLQQHHHLTPAAASSTITIAPLSATVAVPIAAPTASILSSKKRTHSEMVAGNPNNSVGVGGIISGGVAALGNRRRKLNPTPTAMVQTSLASTVASTLASSSAAVAAVSAASSIASGPAVATPATPAIVESGKADGSDKPVGAAPPGPATSSEHMDFMEQEWNRGPFKPPGYDGSWAEVHDMDLDNPQMLSEEPHGPAGSTAW